MTEMIGVEVDCPFSSTVLRKVVYAGSQSSSFAAAAAELQNLAELQVSHGQVERWTKRIGQQRVEQVKAAAQEYENLPIPQRRTSPTEQIPQVACIQPDGGRIQIRPRQECAENQAGGKGYWRETLVGCLLRMSSQPSDEDPCPIIPQTFVDAARMQELSRDIKGFSASLEEPPEIPDAPEECWQRPKVLVKSVVATRQGIKEFGRRLVAAAHARGFSAAERKAFVADGLSTNWSVHERHFSDYTPIVDFIHAICYVWAAAMAGRCVASGWSDYIQWAQWLWSGETNNVIAALEKRLVDLGTAPQGDESCPPAIVSQSLGYLRNQRSRMKYAEYRQQGLPITSSQIESTIKQINRRVKGTEKFWDEGAEPLLQLAADHLNQTNQFDRFWRDRHHHLEPVRCYRSSA